MNSEELVRFISEAKIACYASERSDRWSKPALEGSKQLEYSSGPYLYVDIYFGSIRFSGIETVYRESDPVWSMVYSGGIIEDIYIEKAGEIYRFLKSALRRVEAENPFRGPAWFSEDPFVYENEMSGAINAFTGLESISKGGNAIYSLSCSGGFIH